MTSIVHSSGVIVPTIVDGYQARREARTIVHPIINRPNPDVTLRAAGLRTGALRCVFADEAEALSAFGIFSSPQVLALTDPDRASIAMSFVVADGDLDIALDEVTRNVWIVRVPFVEVAA